MTASYTDFGNKQIPATLELGVEGMEDGCQRDRYQVHQREGKESAGNSLVTVSW